MTDEKKPRFPNLAGVATAIDKLEFETEAAAKKLMESGVTRVAAKRDAVMEKARARLGGHEVALSDLDAQLDSLDRALGDNSGDRPTTPPDGGDPGDDRGGSQG